MYEGNYGLCDDNEDAFSGWEEAAKEIRKTHVDKYQNQNETGHIVKYITFYGWVNRDKDALFLLNNPFNPFPSHKIWEIQMPAESMRYTNANVNQGLVSLAEFEIINIVIPYFKALKLPVILFPRQVIFESVPNRDIIGFKALKPRGNGEIDYKDTGKFLELKEFTKRLSIYVREPNINEILGFIEKGMGSLMEWIKFE